MKYEIMAGEVEGNTVRFLTGLPLVGDRLLLVGYSRDYPRVEGEVAAINADLSISWIPNKLLYPGTWWGVIICRRDSQNRAPTFIRASMKEPA